MLQGRADWHERIKAVEREYWAARIAIDRLSTAVTHDATVLGDRAKPRDLGSADENLEGTYLVRMFAEFETAIRSYWRTVRAKSRPGMEVLIARVGAIRKIPNDLIDGAQEVRKHRNNLVHDRDEDADKMTIRDARSRLGKYLARLPEQWVG